ncbi:MAG: hypothetical protein IPO17_02990 [Flavobacteriales bacterium]|nr:hypothetical protein [Flavobacteriales bacterium]
MKVFARVATGLAVLISIGHAQAQNEEDILRFSFLQPGGSARSNGMAGAFGALGADPIAASINPAGFALYSTSEFALTPAFEVQTAKATHYGTSTSASDNRFFFNNLFLQFRAPGNSGSKWTNFSFGLSYDRLASFHWEREAVGEDVPTSISQRFVNEANGTPSSMLDSIFPFSAGLAWSAYAFDPLNDSTDTEYTSAIPIGSRVDQDHRISSAGNVRATSLFFAASYMDELFVGGSIGIYGMRHERNTIHTETTVDQNLELETLTYEENLVTTGSGFDVKLGAVMRAGESARFGLAFHSPVWMQMSDAYTTSVRTVFRDGDNFNFDSPDGTFTYRGRTPLRLIASGAVIVAKRGCFSVDYEFADYRHMRLKPSTGIIDAYDFSYENNVIQDSYRITHQVRVGTEWRIGSNYYIRGGAGYYPDPYVKTDARHGLPLIRYTGGLGYRHARWSVDLAGLYGSRTANYYQYDPSLVDATAEELKEYKLFVTVAYRP